MPDNPISAWFSKVIRPYIRKSLRKSKRQAKLNQQEAHVTGRVLKSLPATYITLEDLLFKLNNRYAMIDYLVISTYGIYVIEALSYAGKIYGDQDKELWLRELSKLRRLLFFNPTIQVSENITVLKAILNRYSDISYYPIITFSRRARLKKISSTIPVIFDTDVSDTIYSKRAEICLSADDILKIKALLIEANITDTLERETYYKAIN